MGKGAIMEAQVPVSPINALPIIAHETGESSTRALIHTNPPILHSLT